MVNGGPQTAIYRTSDGGRNWTKLTNGLPTGRIGRIGLDIYPKNPDIVYAVIENDNPRPTPVAAPAGAQQASARGVAAGGVAAAAGQPRQAGGRASVCLPSAASCTARTTAASRG